MGHTAVSATQASSVTFLFWQHGAKENNSKFETFKLVVNTKSCIIQMVPNHFDKFSLRYMHATQVKNNDLCHNGLSRCYHLEESIFILRDIRSDSEFLFH